MIRIENVTILKVMTFFCFRGICLLKQTASGAQSVASPSKIEGFREFEADLSALFFQVNIMAATVYQPCHVSTKAI